MFTRSERRASEQEQTKSAISDHVARENHVINWDDAKILGKEHDKRAREVREAIEIRKRGAKTLNRDEGTYLLSHVYDPLIREHLLGKRLVTAKVDQMQMVILMKSSDVVRQNMKLQWVKPGFVTHNFYNFVEFATNLINLLPMLEFCKFKCEYFQHILRVFNIPLKRAFSEGRSENKNELICLIF